jgi:hypothetical protein
LKARQQSLIAQTKPDVVVVASVVEVVGARVFVVNDGVGDGDMDFGPGDGVIVIVMRGVWGAASDAAVVGGVMGVVVAVASLLVLELMQ